MLEPLGPGVGAAGTWCWSRWDLVLEPLGPGVGAAGPCSVLWVKSKGQQCVNEGSSKRVETLAFVSKMSLQSKLIFTIILILGLLNIYVILKYQPSRLTVQHSIDDPTNSQKIIILIYDVHREKKKDGTASMLYKNYTSVD